MVLIKESGESFKLTNTADFEKVTSCGYTFLSLCGAPTVIATLTGITAADVEMTTMEFAMTKDLIDGIEAKVAAEELNSNTAYSFPDYG